MGYTAKCEASGLDNVAVDLEAGGDGDKSEGVTLAVANFEVVGVLCELWRGEFDRGDEFVGLEVGVELWGSAGKAVEVGDGNGALALRTLNVDSGVECGQGYVHIGGVGGDAHVACAEDCVDAIEALDGGATAAGGALVASGKLVSMK